MSTTTFAYDEDVTVLSGPAEFGNVGGNPNMAKRGPSVTVSFKFTGTALDLWVFAGATGAFSATIDGSTSTVTPSGSGWTTVSVCSSLSDVEHTAVLDVTTFFRTDQMLVVTGASPALAAPDDVSVPMPIFTTTGLKLDGYWPDGVNGYRLARLLDTLRFRATTPAFSIWQYDFGNKFALYVDGVHESVTTGPNTGGTTASYVTFDGLDDTTEHLYEVVCLSTQSYVYAMVLGGGGSLNTGATYSDRPIDGYYGDSIAVGAGLSDLSQSFMQLHSRAMGRQAVLVGAGGQSLVGYGDSHTADITGLSPKPDRIFALYGTNDDEGDVTDGTFEDQAEVLLGGLLSEAPDAEVIQLKLMPESTFGPRNAALLAAATAAGVQFIDHTSGFDITSGVHTFEGRHPNEAGSAILADNLTAAFSGPANAAPDTPTLTAGTPTASGVTLTGSAFADDDADTHAASQWQVTTAADTGYAATVISTGDDAVNLTSYAATGLTAGTAYRARVRYKDSAESYSAWSSDATFTTATIPLAAGTASFVSSGPGGISVAATAPSDGSGSGPTYQWERNSNGGSYADLSGKTTLAITDATATTAGVLYGYRCKQTRGAETVTTNAITAQAYGGGALSSGGGSFFGSAYVS